MNHQLQACTLQSKHQAVYPLPAQPHLHSLPSRLSALPSALSNLAQQASGQQQGCHWRGALGLAAHSIKQKSRWRSGLQMMKAGSSK